MQDQRISLEFVGRVCYRNQLLGPSSKHVTCKPSSGLHLFVESHVVLSSWETADAALGLLSGVFDRQEKKGEYIKANQLKFFDYTVCQPPGYLQPNYPKES
jgi:hypothetical protein